MGRLIHTSQSGFQKSSSEATLYTNCNANGGIIIVSVYVDDILYTGNAFEMIQKFKEDMMIKYEMSDLGTRANLMYATSLLARFMHTPSNKYLGASRRVLRYVQRTLEYGLKYEKEKGAVLIGYCDSDWSGSEYDMRSTLGYVFSFGSGMFSWASVKQSCVALSIAEIEYIGASEATTQAIWLRFVLEDFGEMQT
ncbi:unnamed protein product [Malus baccata var. baccata]